MYSDWVSLALAGFLTFWLLGLTYLIWQQGKFLKSLFPKIGERDIRRKFEEVLKQLVDLKGDQDKLKDHLAKVEQEGLKFIKRVELLRYNPYDDTGGDQSFSLALLNSNGDGFVITSLHARSGTRVFAKPIHLGKGVKHSLSEEEKKVVEGAMK